MDNDFTKTILGNTGFKVHRFGLSTTYRPGIKTIYAAVDAGINLFFGYGIDTQMMRVLKDLFQTRREDFVVATGAYNFIIGHSDLRKTLEKRLRQLKTEYIDIFMFMGVMKEKQFPGELLEEMQRLKEEGKVRALAISTHDRKYAGQLAERGTLDALMVRYNAAHRGAEQDIFPHLEEHNPGIISYTATRWRYLLRKPSGYPKSENIPTAGMCYRFVLSNPHVHVCLSAPSNMRHLKENLAELAKGPLSTEEMEFMRKFGDIVHSKKKWFM